MKIESKISGWAITDIDNIKPVETCLSKKQVMEMPEEVRTAIERDYYHYNSLIYAHLGMDDAYKLAIYLNYPEELKELKEWFGENWYQYYLRFNH